MKRLSVAGSRKAVLLSAVFGLALMVPGGAQAMSLKEAIQLVVSTNPDVTEQAKNRRSIDQELRQARGLYLPQIDVQWNAGPEFSENGNVDRPAANLDQGPHDNGRWLVKNDGQVSLQQRIYDGGFADSEVERQKGRIHWGFRISYATFYFDHEHSLRPGLVETGPVCSNPYSIILECFRAMPTVRWLRSGTPF